MLNSNSDRLLVLFSWGSASLLMAGLTVIIGFLIAKGYQSVNLKLIFADTSLVDAFLLKRQVFGGLFPAIIGTLGLIVLSVGIALPMGLAAGIYLAE